MMTTTSTSYTPPSAPTTALAASMTEATKSYGRGDTTVTALDNVTIAFVAGRFAAIMGPSGSGKSTLLHCLAGLEALSSGTVSVGDVDLGSLGDRGLTRLRRDHIGFVFQSFNLVPTLSAKANLLLPATIAGRSVAPDWFEHVVASMGIGDRLEHLPSELSGGQQQRVAVGRAVLARPKVILADEPSGNLDSRSGAEVLGILRRAVDEFGQTVVMVTHDPSAAARSDRVIFLDDGRTVDELELPTATDIIDRMTRFGG